jgi:hypothetical protein
MFMAHLKNATVDDVDIDEIGETDTFGDASEVESQDVSDSGSEHKHAIDVDNMKDTLVPPTAVYTSEQKELRNRCLECAEPADGSHQCGFCFVHLHVICAKPFPGSTEGYGQLLQCHACERKPKPRLRQKLRSEGVTFPI